MIRFKNALIKSIPVFLITIATLTMALFGFNNMLNKETQKCLDWLSVTTRTMSEKIQLRFESSLTLLEHLGDAVVLKVDLDEQSDVLRYLQTIQESQNTIFSRIDILLPDGTIITQTGNTTMYTGTVPFATLVARGRHISPRVTDRLTGKEVLYCYTPICTEGEAKAILIGMVDCHTLPALFPTYSYDGQSTIFLVDRSTGDFIMDKWHGQLGNLYEQASRRLLPAYQHVDFQRELVQGGTGAVAFESNINDHINYMYYMPVSGFNWTVAMMVQDQVAFANVVQMRNSLFIMGGIITILLAFYLIWNIIMGVRLSSHEEEVRRLETERIANETRSTFLSTMSHDLRTPLNGIVGMLDVIEHHGNDPERLKDCLHKIGVSTQYLMTLTNDVLDLSEIESGKLHLATEPIDLHRLVDDLSILLQPRAEETGVTLHLDSSEIKHSHVLGSEIHLRRILINLATNAIKYNKENGEVWVTLAEHAFGNNRADYRFTVRDTGIGMTEAFQQSMFSSFTQENDARTRHNGHGLGLTIVGKLVEKMGGTIQVQSQKEVGSTFTVSLSFPLDRTQRAQASAQPVNTDLTGTRILLVEDNELNLEIAQVLLTDAGASITTAVNGKEAVAKFRASAPGAFDVILMDLMMPEMDGIEATRSIRSLSHYDARTIPIIAMTASTFAEDVQRCRDAGMNEHVGKPLDMAELIAKIARHRDRQA